MNLDRDFYLVVSELPNCGPLILEVELHRMGLVQVIKDIRDGQYRDVLAVIQFNPVEHTCRDCTEDFRPVIDDHAEAKREVQR